MAVEELLDLARIDVLAAADHHVLEPADDVARSPARPSSRGRRCASSRPRRSPRRSSPRRSSSPSSPSSRGCRARRSRRAARALPSASTILISICGMHAADGRDAPLHRIVGRASGSDTGRGLGHAVGDGDLAHVHLGSCTCFITSIGHGEPAMMPVRRLVEVELRELGMVELGDEHGRHAVERRAALLGDGLQRRQRIERLGRDRPWSRRASGSRDCPSPCRSSDRAAPGCRAGRRG